MLAEPHTSQKKVLRSSFSGRDSYPQHKVRRKTLRWQRQTLSKNCRKEIMLSHVISFFVIFVPYHDMTGLAEAHIHEQSTHALSCHIQ